MLFRTIRQRGAVLVLALCSALYAAQALAESPFVDLVDTNGVAVDDQANVGDGKWTVVMVWATNCHVCEAQKPMISAFHEENKDGGNARVFGLVLDGTERLAKIRQIEEHLPVSFPSFTGDAGALRMQFLSVALEEVRGTPTYLVFGPEGKIRAVNPGRLREGALERFIEQNS